MDTLQQSRIKPLFDFPINLRSLIDEIPLGIIILDMDRRIMLLNRSFESLTGFSQNEAAGVPCYHILRSKMCIKGCPALNMKQESKPVCMESDLINRDRNLIPVRVNLALLKDPDHKAVGFLETVEDMRPIKELDAQKSHAYSFAHLIGRSPQMEKIFQILPVFAQSDSSVLITGETGTGKDLAAEAIHQASNRAKRPFVKVNCGALPETLLESELFGHRKGAFTGAVENKPGRFRLAHNGTLYLTEIGDLPLSLQVKLLTFLDDQMVYPLGGTTGFQANVRVIAATHRNLEQMVQTGRFREDLLFRLNVVRIHLPPLRERRGDVRLLLDYFLNSLNSRFRKNIKGFSNKTLDILKGYPYPGNVRELRNISEYAVNVCQEEKIQPHHLPAYIVEMKPMIEAQVLPPIQTGLNEYTLPETEQTWGAMERKLIMDALVKTGGRRSKTAELLGWGRSTLWRKMKQYGINQ